MLRIAIIVSHNTCKGLILVIQKKKYIFNFLSKIENTSSSAAK